jgi:hypothetical protein
MGGARGDVAVSISTSPSLVATTVPSPSTTSTNVLNLIAFSRPMHKRVLIQQ